MGLGATCVLFKQVGKPAHLTSRLDEQGLVSEFSEFNPMDLTPKPQAHMAQTLNPKR